MIIGPPSESQLKKDLLEDALRLRGGGVGCACCGGGGDDAQRSSPLEPQPQVSQSRPDPVTQRPPANQRVPRLSQPTPPTQVTQAGQSEKTPKTPKSPAGTLAVPSRTVRTHSSPAAPPVLASTSQPSAQSRTRYQTLPSKLSANKAGPLSSPSGSAPIPEGSIDYGGGIMRSPAFPPSVHVAGGSRKTAGGPPPVIAPFMKD